MLGDLLKRFCDFGYWLALSVAAFLALGWNLIPWPASWVEAVYARGLYRWLSREDRHAATGRWTERASDMEAKALAAEWDIVLRPS